jgi:hypothetical protein
MPLVRGSSSAHRLPLSVLSRTALPRWLCVVPRGRLPVVAPATHNAEEGAQPMPEMASVPAGSGTGDQLRPLLELVKIAPRLPADPASRQRLAEAHVTWSRSYAPRTAEKDHVDPPSVVRPTVAAPRADSPAARHVLVVGQVILPKLPTTDAGTTLGEGA